MKVKLIGIILAVLVVGGGAGAFIMSRDSDDSKSSSNNSNTTKEETKTESATPTFSPKATKNQSFSATLEGTSEGDALTGTIESDGKGIIHFTGTQAGETAEYYVTSDGSFIFCQGTQCFKSSASENSVSPDDYEVTDEDIAKYQSKATFLGSESCPSGTCNVWQYTDDENVKTKIYIDKDTDYVSQVVGEDGTDTFKIVYNFKDVSITVPTDVQDLSNLGQ
jgi:hypothetical protein